MILQLRLVNEAEVPNVSHGFFKESNSKSVNSSFGIINFLRLPNLSFWIIIHKFRDDGLHLVFITFL